MHVVADNFNGHRRGVEVFKLQLTHAAAVDGIGPLGVKGVDVEMLRAFPTSSSGVKATRISPCGIFFSAPPARS
jgi:hypothetical protein